MKIAIGESEVVCRKGTGNSSAKKNELKDKPWSTKYYKDWATQTQTNM